MQKAMPIVDQDFLLSDQLGRCNPLARLLYLGLHLVADEDKRIPNRPQRLQAQLLPYEEGPVADELLEQLKNENLVSFDDEHIKLLPYWRPDFAPGVVEKQVTSAQQPVKQKPVVTPKKMQKPKAGGRPSRVHEWIDNPAKAEQVRNWVREGISKTSLAKKMGISAGSVYYWEKIHPGFAELLATEPAPEPAEPPVEQEVAVKQKVTVLPPVEVAPEPERRHGYVEWLEDPERKKQLQGWVAKDLPTSEIAKKMGVSANVLVQWKVMSNEFAALFAAPRRKRLVD